MNDHVRFNWFDPVADGTPFFWGVDYSSSVIFTDTNLYLGYTTDFLTFGDFYNVVYDTQMNWYDVTHDESTFMATINRIIHRYAYNYSLTSSVVLWVWNSKSRSFEKTNWKAILDK